MRAELRHRPAPADLLAAPLITSERAPIGWEQWLRARGVMGGVRRGLRFDRGYLALQAAVLGLGVALESTVFAGQHFADGSLVRVFPENAGDVVIGAHTLVFPPIYEEVEKVRLFRDWILNECEMGYLDSRSA